MELVRHQKAVDLQGLPVAGTIRFPGADKRLATVAGAGACVGVGLGLQFVIPILVVIVITVVLITTGTRPDQVEAALGWWAFGISALCIALSLLGMFLILRHVAQLPEDQECGDAPPPPPTFQE